MIVSTKEYIMQIKNFFIKTLFILIFSKLIYASNTCPLWFPMPSNDGLVVVLPIYPHNITEPDLDCDGVIDTEDSDMDGDGVVNNSDAFPLDSSESIDTDHDGLGNNADLDDDNDGYSDSEEILSGSDPLDANSTPINISQKRIFILGSSTVHAGDYISGDFNDPYGSDRKLEGWGEHLKYYMKDPNKVYNRARSGADSITYREPDPIRGDLDGFKDRYWGFTETLITTTNDNNGGFLFIQFGANDAHHEIGTDVFEDQLEAYISDARRLGLIPVLITPPNSRNHYDSRPYAAYIEPVATRNNVLFLDLHQKSMDVWSGYEINEDYDGDGVEDNPLFQTLPEADILYGYLEYDNGINNTHFSPTGANIVAGWVKELACQSNRDDAKLLCRQFLEQRNTPNEVPPVIALKGTSTINVNINTPYIEKNATASDDIDGDISTNIITTGSVDIHTLDSYTITYSVSDSSGNEVNTTRTVNVIDASAGVETIREDAEDGSAARWNAYIGAGTIANVADNGGRVIEFTGQDGTNNAYAYDLPNGTGAQGYVVSWDMKFDEAFKFMVKVHTVNNGYVYITYVPEEIDEGNRTENSLEYVYLALGEDADDGTWRTFKRDVVADLHKAHLDFEIDFIKGFRVRGNGSIDNIKTITRESRAVFSYGGHSYEIIKSLASWQEASDDAVAKGGYLVHIDSKAENEEIYSRLYRYITTAEFTNTRAADGGNASYVWIGGSDHDDEASWQWSDDNSEFSQGTNPVAGMFTNWGQAWGAAQSTEPDDWHDANLAPQGQDFAAMAVNNPLHPGSDLGNHRDWPWGLAGQWNDVAIGNSLYYIIEFN